MNSNIPERNPEPTIASIHFISKRKRGSAQLVSLAKRSVKEDYGDRLSSLGQIGQVNFSLAPLKKCSQEEVNMIMLICYMLKYVSATVSIHENAGSDHKVVHIGKSALDKSEEERLCAVKCIDTLVQLKFIEKDRGQEATFKLTVYGNVLVGMLHNFCKQLM